MRKTLKALGLFCMGVIFCWNSIAFGEIRSMKSMGVSTGERGSMNRPAIGPTSEIQSIDAPRFNDASASDRATWVEAEVVVREIFNESKVDQIRGPDGNLWAVFFDDENGDPTYTTPAYGTYYIRTSTDGGVSWQSPFLNSGFILSSDYGDFPSIAMRQISAGVARIIIAVTGSYSGYANTVWAYKTVGDGSWSMTVAQGVAESYFMPRIIYASNGSGNRLVSASVRQADGNFFADYSDTDGASATNYSQVTDVGFDWVFQPDIAYHSTANYLFFVMNAAVSADPNKAYCLLSLSTNKAATWRTTSTGGIWIVGSATVYSYEGCVIETSHGLATAGSNWMIVGSQRISSYTDDADMSLVYGNFSSITLGSGTWDPGTVYPYAFPADTELDEGCAAITTIDGTGGSYQVSWLDDNTSTSDKVWYSNCDFTAPSSWLTPELVNLNASSIAWTGVGCMSGIAMAGATDAYYPVVLWSDNRNLTRDIYSAYRTDNPPSTVTPTETPTSIVTATPTQTPTETQTPTSTSTPEPTDTPGALVTDTPTSTGTPPPVPATGPMGIGLLVFVMSILAFASGISRKG